MIATLWMLQVKQGKKSYDQVPRQLKEDVKELLLDSGCEDLVTE